MTAMLAGCTGEPPSGFLDPATVNDAVTDASSASGDNDQDRIPDALEFALCGRALVANAVNQAGFGACYDDDLTNWHPPEVPVMFLLPDVKGATTDADNDGFPASASVSITQYRFDPLASGDVLVASAAAEIATVDVDPNDDDANDPVVSQITLPTGVQPVLITPLADEDKDGFPTGITVRLRDIIVDRAPPAGVISVSWGPIWSQTELVDPDDGDASVPVMQIIQAAVPKYFRHGPDADNDLVPATIGVGIITVDVDRTNPLGFRISNNEITLNLDSDDNNRDVQGAVHGGETGITWSVLDYDGDYLPDDLEDGFICQVEDRTMDEDGVCYTDEQSGRLNYHAPASVQNPWTTIPWRVGL